MKSRPLSTKRKGRIGKFLDKQTSRYSDHRVPELLAGRNNRPVGWTAGSARVIAHPVAELREVSLPWDLLRGAAGATNDGDKVPGKKW